MQQLAFYAMGCEMLAVLDSTASEISTVLSDAPGWFSEWERCLSRFRDDSELTRLNRSGVETRVSRVLWRVVQAALLAARQSDGLVTPTLLAELEGAGYDDTFEIVRGREPETFSDR